MYLQIDHNFSNQTLESFFNFYHLSKQTVSQLAKDKKIFVNDQEVDLNCKLQINDILYIDFQDHKKIPQYKGKIDIIYEDDDLLIIHKEPNILVHSDGNSIDTLANRISFHYQNEEYCPRHIHRLDYETSGMVVFAKNPLALSYLDNLIASHQMKKEYICLCHNAFVKLKGTIDYKIGKDRHENKMRISTTGKEAKTIYQVLENGPISKVKVQIVGGRRHQIRVHMASINHPLIGDKLYGKGEDERLMLHFQKVEFIHPRTLKTFICEDNNYF